MLYQEDIEVSIHMYSPSPNDLQHTLAVVGMHTAGVCANIVDGNHMYEGISYIHITEVFNMY